MADNRQFWADRIAEQVIYKVDNSEELTSIVKKKGYIIYDEKTPSGQIHIGSGRGWVIHDAVAKALRDKGKNAIFILSSDDMDPMDALPKLENQDYWKKYMGFPFRDIPSPIEGFESYGDYYFKEATSKFDEYGIEAKFESTGQRYIDGDFNKTIKTALDNSSKIQEIFSRFYDTNVMENKLPFNPKCSQCGKIGTTRAIKWNSETEKLTYKCETDLVTWATGCGFEGEISPYNGNGKFPWKVEWAAKWPTVGVIFETAGKDHFSAGGSRDISMAIANEVFNYPVPLPSSVKSSDKGFIYKRGEAYEFFLIGGAKMSSSKGQGFAFSEMPKYAPGNILKFILVRSRPKTAINFDPQLDLERAYRDYDDTEKKFYDSLENPKLLEKDKFFNAKRLYELAHVGKIPKTRPPSVEFNFGLMLVQLTNSTSEAVDRLQQKLKIPKELTDKERSLIEKRLDFLRQWLIDLAPENKIISLKVPDSLKLDDIQLLMIEDFIDIVKNNENEKDLLIAIKDLIAKFDIDIKKFYDIVYNLLFAKKKGPRLIPYIIFAGSDLIQNHLNKFLDNHA